MTFLQRTRPFGGTITREKSGNIEPSQRLLEPIIAGKEHVEE